MIGRRALRRLRDSETCSEKAFKHSAAFISPRLRFAGKQRLRARGTRALQLSWRLILMHFVNKTNGVQK